MQSGNEVLQFVQYYKIIFFIKKFYENVARKLVPGPF